MPFKVGVKEVRWHASVLALQRKEAACGHERGGCRDWFKRLCPVWGIGYGETVDDFGTGKLFDAQQARMYEPLDHDGSEDD